MKVKDLVFVLDKENFWNDLVLSYENGPSNYDEIIGKYNFTELEKIEKKILELEIVNIKVSAIFDALLLVVKNET